MDKLESYEILNLINKKINELMIEKEKYENQYYNKVTQISNLTEEQKYELESFIRLIRDSVSEINNKFIKRKSKKIGFNEVLWFSINLLNSQSQAIVLNDMKLDGILNVSESSLCKQRLDVNYDIRDEKNNVTCKNKVLKYMDFLNDKILDFIYKNEEPQFIAIDSSIINVNKALIKDGYKQKGEHCCARLSCHFDVIKEIPINYVLSNGYISERDLVQNNDLPKHVKEQATYICDRGYYSINQHNYCLTKNLNYLYRLSTGNKYVLKDIPEENGDVIKEHNGVQVRIISYKLNNKNYYLLTSLFDAKVDFLKDLYHKRWTIETNFGHVKHTFKHNYFRSKRDQTLQLDIKVTMFVQLVSYVLSSFHSELENNDEYYIKINQKSCLDLTLKFLKSVLFDKDITNILNKSEIIVKIIVNTTVKCKKNRNFPRIYHKPQSRWFVEVIPNNKPPKEELVITRNKKIYTSNVKT